MAQTSPTRNERRKAMRPASEEALAEPDASEGGSEGAFLAEGGPEHGPAPAVNEATGGGMGEGRPGRQLGPPTRIPKLLRRKAGLDRAPSTLAKLAVIGGGPIFRRAGRVPLYSPEDLDAWAESLLSPPMRSTSEAV
jgi:hypothetical protein